MIYQSSLLSVGVMLFLTAAIAPAQNNRNTHPDDTNGDGRISRAEWRGTATEFRQLDSNRDNMLSGTEIPGDSVDNSRVNRGSQGRQGSAEVRQLDKNASGVVEGYEWPYNRQVFHQLDTDQNSVLSSDELRNMSSVTLKELDRNGNGRLDANERSGDYADLDRLDANRDGKISPDEYVQRGGEWQKRQRFDQWDTNRNGVIDSTERRTAPQLFRRLDTDGDAKVTWEEFRADTERYQPPYNWR
jgi:Ca2+-binding EF-hand superfamily protein